VIGVDTNVLVRYFTQDDPRQSPLAKRFINDTLTREAPGYVNLVTLAETVWVLRRVYGIERHEAAEVIATLLAGAQLQIDRRATVRQALQDYSAGGADFADCLIARLNAEAGCKRTVTFDRKAARHAGFELLKS
jgi:predicted nucleic-acid-binding protein